MQRNKEKKLKRVYNTLLFIVAAVTLLLLIGTAAGIKRSKSAKPEQTEFRDAIEKNLFTDLGRLRALTSDKQAGTAVIFPVLEYNGDDKAFQEELVQKKEDIRNIILNWFSEQSMYELYTMPDTAIKKELLENINSILDLSKVKNIYFKEFVILN